MDRLLRPSGADDRRIAASVRAIVSAVRKRGRCRAAPVRPPLRSARRRAGSDSRDEIEEQAARVPPEVRAALAAAARNIEKVARRQRPQGWRVTPQPGVTVEQRVTPLDRVGCYVPGGRYPLPSSLLMTAIPARAAGVARSDRRMPAARAGRDGGGARRGRHPAVSNGRRAGDRRARVRHGDRSARRQDRRARQPVRRRGQGARRSRLRDRLLRGPDGDRHRFRQRQPRVDRRGSDRAGRARSGRARDSDHDESPAGSEESRARWPRRCRRPDPRANRWRGTAASSSRQDGRTRSISPIARPPSTSSATTSGFAARVRAAGAIFVGSYTAQVAGDYAIGSNHVLPTNGAARFRGGLHTADFVRISTVQRMTRQGLQSLAPTVTTLARQEGLEAHARSIEVRLR